MVFLSNYLVFKIVLAALGRVDYPVAGDLELKYDTANKIYLSGGSLDYVDDYTLHTTIGGETTTHVIPQSPRIDFNNETKLTGEATGNFGSGVSIDGDYLAITDSFYDSNDYGKVYIYHRSGTTWSLQNSFTSATSSDYMEAVAISGDYVMAGVRYGDNADTNAGEVLIYKRYGTTWTNTQTLTASDAANGDHFGSSITIKGNHAVVGTGSVSGAYVFTLSNGTWSETQLLTTGTNSDLFGHFVNLSDTDLLIGARGVNSLTGTAYIYTNNGGTFTQQAQITPDDLVGADYFGQTGDIFGDYACVCAPSQNTSTGAAYIFKRSGTTWTQQQKLTASNSATNTKFGYGVHLMSDDTVIIGAYNDDAKGSNAGAAYLFQRTGDTWSEIKIIYPSDIGANDFFGHSISSSETDLVISGPTQDNATGNVYLFPYTKTRNFYITDAGKYSVDATIAGLNYKTNEVEVTTLNPGNAVYTNDLEETSEIDHGTGTGAGLKSCSVSLDGTRVAFGWSNGKAKVYHLETGVWTLKKEYTKSGSFGTQVCLNDAGTRLFVSDPSDNSNTGKVYVYDYSGSAWGSSETHSWVSPNGSTSDKFGGINGKGISCNSAGTRLLVVNGYTGSKKAYIFDYTGSSWNTAPTKSWSSGSSWWGATCALNDAGDRAFIGYQNGIDIFHHDGSNWPTSETKNYTGSDEFGASLTINGTGTRLLVGSYNYSSGAGKTTLYDYVGSSWNTSATQTINGSYGGNSYYGHGVNMSRDGKRYIVAAHNAATYFSGSGFVHMMEDTTGSGSFTLKQTFKPDQADETMGSYAFEEGLCLDQKGYTAVIISAGQEISRIYSSYPIPTLDFDNYNKLSIGNAPTNTSSKLLFGSNVYEIGTLTSDLTIETPGLYRGLVYDTSSNVAYFNKTTVGSITTPPNTHGTFVQSWGSNFWTTTKDLGAHTSSMSFGGWVDLKDDSRAISINDDSNPLNDSETKDWHIYIAKYSNSDHLFSMRNKGDSDVFKLRANTSGEESFPIAKHKDGALTHFVVTTELVSGTYYASLYSNGQFIAKKTWSNTTEYSAFNVKNFRIGKHDYDGTNYGSFSRMFFYSGTLSDSDVNKIYHNYVPKTTGNCVLKCYFPFQNGLNDESGNNNHLVEVGTTNPWPSYTITPEKGVYPGFFNIQGFTSKPYTNTTGQSGYPGGVHTLYYDNKLYEITNDSTESGVTTSESHYHPAQVLDPNRAFIAGTGGWKTANEVGLPHYLTVKLPEAKYISNMFIRERESNGGISGSSGNGSNSPYEIINAWEIEASTDGTTWSSKHSDTGIGNSGKDFALDTPGTFQYWRIKVSSLNVPSAYGSNEFFGIFYWDIVARNFTRDGPHVTTLAKVHYDLKSAPATVGNTPSTTTGITYTNDGAVHDTGSSSLNFSWTSDNADVFSVSFLAKNLGSSQSYFVRSTANSGAPEFEAYLAGSTYVWARSRNDSLDYTYFRVDTSDWTHYVYVHSPVFRGLYINGALVSRRFSTLGGTSGQTSFYSSTSSMFNAGGILSEFRAFSNVLDQHQIQELYDYDMPDIPIQPDPITFDGYNKLTLTLSGPTNPTSKIHALPTGAESTTTYDIGTATNIYIESEGTYTAEMKGSSAFALDSNVVSGTISSIVSPLLHLDFESGGLVSTGLNTTQYKYGSSSLYRNDSSVTVSNDGSYNIGNTSSAKATIMLWVRPESYPSYNGDANRIVVAAEGRSESSQSYKKWAIALRQHSSIDEVWQFHYPNSSNSNKKVSYTPSDIPVGAWYHVCVTIETSSLKFYIDGVDVTSSLTGNKSDIESAWAGFNDDEGFKFCKTDANYLKGWVDDFKLFNSVLTLSEITSHMNASKLSPPSLTFDGFNKYTFTGADTGSTYKLKYESNTYDLGTISNVYIAHPGTYSAEIKGATNFALSSNVTGSLYTYSTLHDNVAISHTTGGGQTLVTVNNIKGNMTYKISFNKQWTDSNGAYSTRLKMYIRDSSDVNIRDLNSIGDYLNNPRDGILLYDGGGSFDESAMVVGTGFSVYGSTGTHTVGITGGTYGSTRSPFTLADPWYFLLTMSTSDVITGKFFVGDTEVISHFLTRPQSGTSGYSIGETGNKFVFEFHSTATISGVNMTVEEYNPAPKLDFDGYNKLTFSGLESGTTSNVTFDGNTYSIGTASNVYISEQGTYEAESKGTTTFALTSKAVGTVSSKPTILPILKFENLGTSLASNVSGVNLVNESGYTAPTYDSTNNAIQTAASSSLVCDFSSVRTSTTSDLAVVFEAYYDEADGLTAVVTLGEYPGSFPNTDFSIDQRSNMGTSIGGLVFDQKAYLTDSSVSGTYTVDAKLDAGDYINKWTKYALVHYEEDAWWYIYVDGEWKLHMSSSQTTTSELQNWLSDGFPSKIRVFNYPSQYATGTYSTGTKVRNIEIYGDVSFIVSPPVIPPSLTHDGYKLVVSGIITPTSSKLKYESNTYDIGTATNIYVENTGAYTAEIGNATDFALMNNTVSGTIKTVTPVINGAYAFGHALTYDGKLYAWGRNGEGEAGISPDSPENWSSVPTPTLAVKNPYSSGTFQGEIVSIWKQSNRGLSRWAKTRDGRIWLTGDRNSYCTPFDAPGPAGAASSGSGDLKNFTDVSLYFGDHTQTSNSVVWASGSERATQVLMENGDVWSYGNDAGAAGVLGQGASPTSDHTPRKLTGISNVTKIVYNGDLVLALDSSNVVWMWGSNTIGGGSTNGWGPYNVPTNIMGTGTANLTGLLVSGETVTDIECGSYSMFVITSKGTVYATGKNASKQLGQGGTTTTTKTSSDGWVKIEYFTSNAITVNKLYTGNENPHVFADTSDGWYCWGNNTSGELGLGDSTDKSTPIKFTGVSNIKVFGTVTNGCYAITEDGKYYAWGEGQLYTRGDNDTGDISYPKYIDSLPNILTPSFEFDGYDKVFVNNPPSGKRFTYIFEVAVAASDTPILNELTASGYTIKESDITVHNTTDFDITKISNGINLNDSCATWNQGGNAQAGDKLLTITTDIDVTSFTWGVQKPKYKMGLKVYKNGVVVLTEGSNAGSGSSPEPANYTLDVSGTGQYDTDWDTKFTKNAIEYDVGKASIITVSDPGTYDAQIKGTTPFVLKSATVPATNATGLYTWAFHHGNFDNAYGDGDILTARDNGRFYADTPAYTGDIGNITPGGFGGPISPITQSGTDADGASWALKWYYDESVTTSNDDGHFYYGESENNGTTVASGNNGIKFNYTNNTWHDANNSSRPYNLTYNTSNGLVEYHEQNNNNGNAYFTSPYFDNKSNTTYTFTPPPGGLTANVLMVAGGGGGGASSGGGNGGGGAGGYVYTADTSLAQGVTKTIVVGNGGLIGDNGNNTTFTGLDNAIGGGGGATAGEGGGDGGSGGGSSHHNPAGSPGDGTSGQGYGGGAGGSNTYKIGGGGGGAGGAGGNASTSSYDAGDGGIGINWTRVFGRFYGDSGWFCSGGGGGGNGTNKDVTGLASIGGGGDGCPRPSSTSTSFHGNDAKPHTGGGGGAMDTLGGSGVVLIQTTATPKNPINENTSRVGYYEHAVSHEIINPKSIKFSEFPNRRDNNSGVQHPHGSGSFVEDIPLPSGAVSNAYRATGYGYMTNGFTDLSGMSQTMDAMFMPLLQVRYEVLISLASVELEMRADGTAALYRGNGITLITAGTIKCFTVGKWHHVALTVDSGGNAIGYVNGYPVVTGTYTGATAMPSRSGTSFRCSLRVHPTWRGDFFVKYVRMIKPLFNPKEIMKLASSVGLGPKLEYDGLNTIKILNTEPGSSVKLFTSNVADTSNVFIVADPSSSEYTVPESGKYYAEIKGTDTFTITKTIDVSGTFPLYAYPPIDGTTSSLTVATAANSFNNIWTISGASTGNGQYQVKCNTAADNNHYNAWRNNVGSTNQWQTAADPTYPITFTILLPSAKTIRKYRMFPLDHDNPNGAGTSATPGTSIDPTLPGNSSGDSTKRPKSWVIRGSNNDSVWTDLDTVTNKPISIYGDVYSIDSPASYQYYQVSITANNGGNKLLLGDIQLWGDA